MSHVMSDANRHALDNDQARSAPLTPTPHISPSSGAGEAVKLRVKLSTISAGRRAFSLTFFITQRDVVNVAHANRRPMQRD